MDASTWLQIQLYFEVSGASLYCIVRNPLDPIQYKRGRERERGQWEEKQVLIEAAYKNKIEKSEPWAGRLDDMKKGWVDWNEWSESN